MTFMEAVKTMVERSGFFIGRPGGIVLMLNQNGYFIRPDRKQVGWLSLRALDVQAIDWDLAPIPGNEKAEANGNA